MVVIMVVVMVDQEDDGVTEKEVVEQEAVIEDQVVVELEVERVLLAEIDH